MGKKCRQANKQKVTAGKGPLTAYRPLIHWTRELRRNSPNATNCNVGSSFGTARLNNANDAYSVCVWKSKLITLWRLSSLCPLWPTAMVLCLPRRGNQIWVEREKSFALCTSIGERATRRWLNSRENKVKPSSRLRIVSLLTIRRCTAAPGRGSCLVGKFPTIVIVVNYHFGSRSVLNVEGKFQWNVKAGQRHTKEKDAQFVLFIAKDSTD